MLTKREAWYLNRRAREAWGDPLPTTIKARIISSSGEELAVVRGPTADAARERAERLRLAARFHDATVHVDQ